MEYKETHNGKLEYRQFKHNGIEIKRKGEEKPFLLSTFAHIIEEFVWIQDNNDKIDELIEEGELEER